MVLTERRLRPQAQDDPPETAVRRPALRYYGGAWTRAPWTVSHFPEHTIYVEPCFGAGSVLLRKQAAKLEIANDLDTRVINFFQVLRTSPAALGNALDFTPWHETEYQNALQPAENPLEDARRFAIVCWMSICGGPDPRRGDFRWQKKETRRSAAVNDFPHSEHLFAIANRLKNVQFLNREALDVIHSVRGTAALIYFDPPYLQTARTRPKGYKFEPDEAWHITAATMLRRHTGPVIVAGYATSLYEELYESHGWERVSRAQAANSGRQATENLWLSPLAQPKN
jgi:DNA adenine methylase